MGFPLMSSSARQVSRQLVGFFSTARTEARQPVALAPKTRAEPGRQKSASWWLARATMGSLCQRPFVSCIANRSAPP